MSDSMMTFAVVERELIDDVDHHIARLFVTQAPRGIDRQDAKAAVDKTGRIFGVDGRRWVNHTLILKQDWPASVEEQFMHRAAEVLSFEELEAEARGEKRVTLRMAKGLHSELMQEADDHGLSFNDYCIAILQNRSGKLPLPPRGTAAMTKLAQRDAMRALYQIFHGNEVLCVENWIRLYGENVVAVGKNPGRYPPDSYAPNLWKDGERKNWLTDKVSADILAFVRSRVDAWKEHDALN